MRQRTLRVERSWNLQRLNPTKTYEERTVDLSPDLLRALERHLVWVKAEALRCGWGEPEWLFPNDAGKPHDESRVRRFHKKGLKHAKLPSLRLYDLRHAYASLLLATRAPIRRFRVRCGTRFGIKSLRNNKSGTPGMPKCPIQLVGGQGLEPWSRVGTRCPLGTEATC
jgi:integrase